jgi:hypothetical protein
VEFDASHREAALKRAERVRDRVVAASEGYAALRSRQLEELAMQGARERFLCLASDLAGEAELLGAPAAANLAILARDIAEAVDESRAVAAMTVAADAVRLAADGRFRHGDREALILLQRLTNLRDALQHEGPLQ